MITLFLFFLFQTTGAQNSLLDTNQNYFVLVPSARACVELTITTELLQKGQYTPEKQREYLVRHRGIVVLWINFETEYNLALTNYNPKAAYRPSHAEYYVVMQDEERYEVKIYNDEGRTEIYLVLTRNGRRIGIDVESPDRYAEPITNKVITTDPQQKGSLALHDDLRWHIDDHRVLHISYNGVLQKMLKPTGKSYILVMSYGNKTTASKVNAGETFSFPVFIKGRGDSNFLLPASLKKRGLQIPDMEAAQSWSHSRVNLVGTFNGINMMIYYKERIGCTPKFCNPLGEFLVQYPETSNHLTAEFWFTRRVTFYETGYVLRYKRRNQGQIVIFTDERKQVKWITWKHPLETGYYNMSMNVPIEIQVQTSPEAIPDESHIKISYDLDRVYLTVLPPPAYESTCIAQKSQVVERH